jgi:hypothetical protein
MATGGCVDRARAGTSVTLRVRANNSYIVRHNAVLFLNYCLN